MRVYALCDNCDETCAPTCVIRFINVVIGNEVNLVKLILMMV